MRVKHQAQKNKRTKGKNTAMSWVPSAFTQKELEKAQADGLISNDDKVILPSTEWIPKPGDGFQVMFFAYLLHGLSLPAHEFLCGLLFVYGVQLHQLTPNSILHIACFITLCKSFLGIDPHFLLWRAPFQLCPNVALSKKPELGGACISLCSELQYLEFSMAASVQGWRTKWFYIKDWKNSPSDKYGLAPFDSSQELKKLASWDSPPLEAEMEEIKPLLARIQELKSDQGGALSGTQLMAFFLQRWVQPLQQHLSKLWTFSGFEDPSRVWENLMEKKYLDRHVRALTTLTKDKEVADLAASHFDSDHPLPAVIFAIFALPFFSFCSLPCILRIVLSLQDHWLLVSRPPVPEGGDIQHVPVSVASEASETEDNHDEDEGEDSLERSSLMMLPPPTQSEDVVVDRKRKRVEEIASSSASIPKTVAGESFKPEDGGELFDYMDS
jgi:hypothetical protein